MIACLESHRGLNCPASHEIAVRRCEARAGLTGIPFAIVVTAAVMFTFASAHLQAQESTGLPVERDTSQAGEFVEKLNGIATDNPELAAQVRAYLHPLTRDVPDEAIPEKQEPAKEPEALPLLVIRTPGGGAMAQRAVSYEKQGDVLIISTETGGKSIVQAKSVAGQLPWYSDEDISGGGVDLKQLAAKYDAAAAGIPALRGYLKGEANKLRSIVEKSEAESEKRGATVQKRIDAVTDVDFDPAAPPSTEKIVDLLEKAESTISEYPSSATEVDEWAAPFREHLGHLLAGDQQVNGKWMTAQELEEAAQAKRTRELRENFRLAIDAQAAPDEALRKMVLIPFWTCAGLFLVALLGMIFLRDPLLRTVALLVLIGTPVALTGFFYLATRNPAGMPTTPTNSTDESIIDLLVATTNSASKGAPQTVEQNALNSFLARRIRLDAGGSPGARRSAFSVQLGKDEIIVFDLVKAFGFEWIIRYRYAYLFENGGISLEPTGAWVGRLRCPGALASPLMQTFESGVADLLSRTRLLASYSVAPAEDGVLNLQPLVQAPVANPKDETPADDDTPDVPIETGSDDSKDKPTAEDQFFGY